MKKITLSLLTLLAIALSSCAVNAEKQFAKTIQAIQEATEQMKKAQTTEQVLKIASELQKEQTKMVAEFTEEQIKEIEKQTAEFTKASHRLMNKIDAQINAAK